MAHSWLSIPTDEELRDPQGWTSLPQNQKAVVRYHLLIVRSTERQIKNGKEVSVIDRVPGAKFTENRRIKVERKGTEQIERAISTTLSTQVSNELTTKVGGSLTASADFSASLSSELQEKLSTTLMQSIENNLKSVSTFSWSFEEEESKMVEQTVPPSSVGAPSVTYTTFYKLREHVWSVYLMKTEYMHLTYKSYLIPWFDSRVILPGIPRDIQKPLFKIRFYEALPDLSTTIQSYLPEVVDDQEIRVVGFNGPIPEKTIPLSTSLEVLAKEAFPVNRKEREKRKLKKRVQKVKPAGAVAQKLPPQNGTARKATGAKRTPKPSQRAKARTSSLQRKKVTVKPKVVKKATSKVAKKTANKPVKKAAKKTVKKTVKKSVKKVAYKAGKKTTTRSVKRSFRK